MKKLNYVFILIICLLFLISCKKNELGVVDLPVPNAGPYCYKTNNILSFKNEQDFRSMVELVSYSESNLRQDVTTRKAESINNFESLFDEFEEAMQEAESYYEREGGYEEFKQKYSSLYFPEFNDDYSAYLPVSDEVVAKLINKEGKVLIGGVERDLRDVSSYSQLIDLGLAIPSDSVEDNIETTFRSSPGSVVILTESKKVINSKRKAWLTLRGGGSEHGMLAEKTYLRIDLCFRKKGWIGWYNGQVSSSAKIVTPNGNLHVFNKKKHEYSPHKFGIGEYDKETRKFLINKGSIPFEFWVDFDTPNSSPIHTAYGFTAKANLDLVHMLKLETGNGWFEKWAPFVIDVFLK